MDPIALRYKRRAERYPDENEEERWNGVALDCYLRTGHVPEEVLYYKAIARAGLLARKYREDQPRVPAGNPDGGQWTDDGGSSGSVDGEEVDGAVGVMRTSPAMKTMSRSHSSTNGVTYSANG